MDRRSGSNRGQQRNVRKSSEYYKQRKQLIRKRKQQRARRRRSFLLLVFMIGLYFAVGPHLSADVGEKETAKPVSASHQSEKETGAKVSDDQYLILVNKNHGLNQSYEPDNLVDAKPAVKGATAYQQVQKPVAEAFRKLSSDAKKQGYIIKVTSGYRPYAYQKKIFTKYVDKDGRYGAEQYSAEPGHSEHQTGLCADVSSPSVNYHLAQAYGTTDEGKWLAKNTHKYGFIIRFPKGKEKITGYEYEPWHIRYVGKAPAKQMYKKKLTLEEYLGEK